MTIYGIGGAIAVALLVAIIVMAGGTIVPNLGGDSDDEPAPTGLRLLDQDGKVDPKAYARLANLVGEDDWIDWRYGETGESGSADTQADTPKTSALDLGDGIDHTYQYGDASAVDPMNNSQGQVGFVASDADSPGVDRVTAVETTPTTLGFAPRAGGRFSQDAAEVELSDGSTADCLAGAQLGRLVDMDRADGSAGSAHAVLAFSSGAIATTGISGASGGTCVQLPENMVPTSVAVTPANEFALVTVWDTAEIRGRVAVVALGDTPGTYRSSWPSTHPGLPNPGHFGFAKLLGFVELKAKAPTAIGVGTDHPGTEVDRTQADLSTIESRSGWADQVAGTGVVTVVSRTEKLVEWIDLTPLLAGVSDSYFAGDPAQYAEPGTDGAAWPPDFATRPDYAPVLAGSVALEAEPYDVTVTGDLAYVADASGALITFSASDPQKPQQTGTIDLPAAAGCLAHTADGEQLLATSRQGRSVSWITPTDDGGDITMTLQDSRITDPICSADTPNPGGNGTTAHVVLVADYGSGALLSYRYGSGALAVGDDVSLDPGSFEFGGGYEPAGKPFAVSVTNDNI